MDAENHVMILQAGDSDTEEWLCPRCGRHLVLRWAPHFDELILARGDEGMPHVGSRTGLVRIGPVRRSTPVENTVAHDSAWRDWLGEHGLPWQDG
jgi:hypothetical protein